MLTPGRYVGSANGDEEDTPFEERFPKLVAELEAQFAESDRLQAEIRAQLARVGAAKNGRA
ncbi:MAG: type I restriction endonuclease subunit M [Betaproteobacteria bacterium]